MLNRLDKDKVILLCVAVGMVMVGLEVRVLHTDVLRNHWEGWIPIVYAVVATLTTLLALGRSSAARALAAAVFVIGMPIGLIGFYEHTDGELRPVLRLFTASAVTVHAQEREDDDDDRPRVVQSNRPRPQRPSGPPPLAPLGLAGLAAIGAAVLLLRRSE